MTKYTVEQNNGERSVVGRNHVGHIVIIHACGDLTLTEAKIMARGLATEQTRVEAQRERDGY